MHHAELPVTPLLSPYEWARRCLAETSIHPLNEGYVRLKISEVQATLSLALMSYRGPAPKNHCKQELQQYVDNKKAQGINGMTVQLLDWLVRQDSFLTEVVDQAEKSVRQRALSATSSFDSLSDSAPTAGHSGFEPAFNPATRAAAEVPLTKAAQDVLAERARQIGEKRWLPAHDDTYKKHELAQAAACYAFPELTALTDVPIWPWSADQLKLRDARQNYVRAAALLLAEIERLDRQDALSSRGLTS